MCPDPKKQTKKKPPKKKTKERGISFLSLVCELQRGCRRDKQCFGFIKRIKPAISFTCPFLQSICWWCNVCLQLSRRQMNRSVN